MKRKSRSMIGAAALVGALLATSIVGLVNIKTTKSDVTHHNLFDRADVYLDWQTGCEYLITKEGGITPRLSTQHLDRFSPICWGPFFEDPTE